MADSAADLAALAGAVRVLDGEEAACRRAAEISAVNGAHLTACQVDGFDVTVRIDAWVSSPPRSWR